VDLRDPVRLKDFAVSGKLSFSLKNYLELVMANNNRHPGDVSEPGDPEKQTSRRSYGLWDPTANATFSTTRSTSVPTSATVAQTASLGFDLKIAEPTALDVVYQALDNRHELHRVVRRHEELV